MEKHSVGIPASTRAQEARVEKRPRVRNKEEGYFRGGDALLGRAEGQTLQTLLAVSGSPLAKYGG